jgi:hypothetical protein
MRELSIEKMEMVSGGWWNLACTMTVISAVGVTASLISIPASGPIGLNVAVALATTAITTGGSLGECMHSFASR